jgi:yecA family protein
MNLLGGPLGPIELQKLAGYLKPFGSKAHGLEWADGFMHGIASLPVVVPPGEWLPEILPEDALREKEQAPKMFDLVFRHYNAVIKGLMESQLRLYCDGSGAASLLWLKGLAAAFDMDHEALDALADQEEEVSEDGNLAIAPILLSQILDLDHITPDRHGDHATMVGLRDYLQERFQTDPLEKNLQFLKDFAQEVYALLEPLRHPAQNVPTRKR